jgi:glyoxylase I family protein
VATKEKNMQITALGHAGIGVRDLQASRRFYEGVLGMSLRSTELHSLKFQVSESEQLLVREVDPPFGAALTGVHHIAFIVGNTPARLDAAAQQLTLHRVDYERVAHEEHESLYCRDPDGHIVELYYWPSW